MGVPFQCCSHLQAMEAVVSIGSVRDPKHHPGSDRRRGLRRLISPCWTHAPLDAVVSSSPSLDFSPFHSLPDDLLLDCLARLPRSSLHSAMMVCRRWMAAVQSPVYLERRRRIGTLESLLLVFGGAGMMAYSEREGSWRAVVPAEPQQQMLLLQAQAAAVGHRVFMVGGSATLVYDSWAETVRRAAPMPWARKKFACCAVDGRILVAGGRDPARPAAAVAEAHEYDPGEDAWRPIASMPRGRYACLGVAVGASFYVIGGLKSSSGGGGAAAAAAAALGMRMHPPYFYTYLSSMDVYDAEAKIWQKTRAVPTGGCVIACTAVASCIYMLSSHAVELSLWRYDTLADTWSRMKAPPIPSPLRLDNRLRFSCAAVGSRVYVLQVGGTIDDLLRRSGRTTRGLSGGLLLIYDTLTHTWSRGPDLPFSSAIVKHSVAAAAAAVVHC